MNLTESIVRLLSNKKSAEIAGIGGAVLTAETHLPKLKRLGKTARIRLDRVDNFEADLMSDVSLLRFIKVVIPISSINPLSLATDVVLRLAYTLDMITDINGASDINALLKYVNDVGSNIAKSILRMVKEGSGGLIPITTDEGAVMNITIFTPVDDMVWPDVMWRTNAMFNITEMPYYLSLELLRAYADVVHDEAASVLIINY